MIRLFRIWGLITLFTFLSFVVTSAQNGIGFQPDSSNNLRVTATVSFNSFDIQSGLLYGSVRDIAENQGAFISVVTPNDQSSLGGAGTGLGIALSRSYNYGFELGVNAQVIPLEDGFVQYTCLYNDKTVSYSLESKATYATIGLSLGYELLPFKTLPNKRYLAAIPYAGIGIRTALNESVEGMEEVTLTNSGNVERNEISTVFSKKQKTYYDAFVGVKLKIFPVVISYEIRGFNRDYYERSPNQVNTGKNYTPGILSQLGVGILI